MATEPGLPPLPRPLDGWTTIYGGGGSGKRKLYADDEPATSSDPPLFSSDDHLQAGIVEDETAPRRKRQYRIADDGGTLKPSRNQRLLAPSESSQGTRTAKCGWRAKIWKIQSSWVTRLQSPVHAKDHRQLHHWRHQRATDQRVLLLFAAAVSRWLGVQQRGLTCRQTKTMIAASSASSTTVLSAVWRKSIFGRCTCSSPPSFHFGTVPVLVP